MKNVLEKVITGNVVTKGVSSGLPSVVMQGERESFGDVEFWLRHYGLGKFSGPELTQPRDFTKEKENKKEKMVFIDFYTHTYIYINLYLFCT